MRSTRVRAGRFSGAEVPRAGGADSPLAQQVCWRRGREGLIRRRGRGEGVFEGRAAIGYDHGYDAGVFYLGLALDERYVGGASRR